jgi:hypothetical protein
MRRDRVTPMSHVRMAILENQHGHFEAALSHAERAIRARQGGAVPYLCAAFAAAQLTGNDSALTWLDQALVVEPSNCLALGTRANLLRELNRAGEGLGNGRHWVALEPDNGAARSSTRHLAWTRRRFRTTPTRWICYRTRQRP